MTATIPVARLEVFVPGRPAPQGSKRHVGHGRMIEMSKYVGTWRDDIRATVRSAMNATRHPGHAAGTPVFVALEFVLPRPTSTPKTRTPSAVKRPDLDKLARAVLDALTSAGAWADDSQVVGMVLTKRLAERDETPGCHISIKPREVTR